MATLIGVYAVSAVFVILVKRFNLIKRSLAPYIIVASLIFMFSALSAILVVSKTLNPPENDLRYMQSYQEVDKRVNQIREDNAVFDSIYNYEFKFTKFSNEPIGVKNTHGKIDNFEHSFTIGENGFSFALNDKTGEVITDAKIAAQISRVDTNAYDQEINATFGENEYNFDNIEIKSEGRYRVTLRVLAPAASAYLIREIYAR
jgi:hypothetical protein